MPAPVYDAMGIKIELCQHGASYRGRCKDCEADSDARRKALGDGYSEADLKLSRFSNTRTGKSSRWVPGRSTLKIHAARVSGGQVWR